MIDQLSNYVTIVFILTTLLTFVLFMYAVTSSKLKQHRIWIGFGLTAWLVFHMLLSYNLFYVESIGDTPPKFPIIGLVPTFIVMIYLFNSTKGKEFIDSLPLNKLTFLSIVRVPVEIVLWWLFLNGHIPEIMTFEGQNWDILAGISAPLVAYFGFAKKKLKRSALIAWNIVCLALLINIVLTALFSFPTVFQKLSFAQPNMGLLYFPFFWLPSFIVPIVFFSHFVSIRQLLYNKEF